MYQEMRYDLLDQLHYSVIDVISAACCHSIPIPHLHDHEIHHHRPPSSLASAATATLTITEPSCARWCKSLANRFPHFDCAQSISVFYCCGSRILSVAGQSPIIIVYIPGQPLGPVWTDDRCHRDHPEFEYPCPG